MTFYVYTPDYSDIKGKERIKKYKKQISEEKNKGNAISLGTSEEHYKVLEQSKDHKVIDLQQPIKKDSKMTIKEFNETLFGL